MRVGSLEIEIMAGIARLQKDMNDAQRIVGGAMANVEKSVASAKRAMQTLGVGLPLLGIIDQVRRMTDQYTKLDAQLRLSTKTQAQYAQGMSDIRRISSIAQADISATSMLYTRLINVMQGTGVEQSKLATVTETVNFGLKAYGATAQEASSAALQLSQAMGANRLGGEEFRAVMEAMPNVMRVVADSMGVPLGALRQLSIEGKITADVLVKALGDPAIAAQFKAMAENTQTVTGAWIVARNELMLLVGEFGKSSGGVNIFIGAFKALGETFALMAQYMQQLISLATVMSVLYAGKYVVAMQSAWMVTRAHTEELLMDAAGEKAHAAVVAQAKAAEALASNAAAAAKLKETIAAREALFAAEAEMIAKVASTRATIAQTDAAAASTFGFLANTAAKQANVVATAELALAEATLTKINKARNAAQVEAIAMDAVRTREMKAHTVATAAATAAAAAAEEARVAATLSGFAKIRAFAVSNAFGLIGLAMWGAYEIADHLGWIDKIFANADTRLKKLREDILSSREIPSQVGRNAPADAGAFNVVPGLTEDIIKTYFKSVGDVSQDFKTRVMSDSFVFSKDFLSKEQERAAKAAKITADYYAEMDKLQKTAGLSEKAYRDAAIQLYATYTQRRDALNKEEIAAAGNAHTTKMQQTLAALQAEAAAEEGKLSRVQKVSLAYQALKVKEQTLAEYGTFVLALEQAALLDAKDAQEELSKQLASGTEAYNDFWVGVEQSTEKLIEQSKQQEFENSLIGETKTGIAALTKLRENDAIVQEEAALGVMLTNGAKEEEIRLLALHIEALYRLKDAREGKATAEAAQAAIDAQTKAAEEQWKMIDGFAHTAFDNIFDKGRDTFKEIGNAIKKYVLGMLYKMTVQKWMISVGIGGAGIGAAGTAQAATGASSFGGLLDVTGLIGGSLGTFGTGIASAMSTGIVAGFGNGMAALGLGQIGAGLGMMAPGLAIGAVVLSSLFGNKGTPTSSTGDASMNFGTNRDVIGFNKMGDYVTTQNDAVDLFVVKMNEAYLSAAKNLGLTAANTTFAYATNTGKDGKKPMFGIGGGVTGKTYYNSSETALSKEAVVLDWTRAIFTALKDSVDESNQYLMTAFNTIKDIGAASQADLDNAQQFAATLYAVSPALVLAGVTLDDLSVSANIMGEAAMGIQSPLGSTQMSMTEFANAVLDLQHTNETATQATVRLAGDYILTNDIAKMLGQDTVTAFGGMGAASLSARDDFVLLMGGLDTAGATTAAYYQFTQTGAEQTADAVTNVTKSFNDLGFELPTSADAFQTLVESIGTTTPEAAALTAKLLNLTPAFSAVTLSAEQMLARFNEVSANMRNAQVGIFGETTNPYLAQLAKLNKDWGNVDALQRIDTKGSDWKAILQLAYDGVVGGVADLMANAVSWRPTSAAENPYVLADKTTSSKADTSVQDNIAALAELMSGIDYTALTLGMSAYEKSLLDITRATDASVTQATLLGATEAQLATIRALGVAQALEVTTAAETARVAATKTLSEQLFALQHTEAENTAHMRELKLAELALQETQLGMSPGTLTAIQNQIDAQTDLNAVNAKATALDKTNQGWQDQIDVLNGVTTAREQELRGVDATTAALMKTAWAAQDAKAGLDKFNGAMSSLGSRQQGLDVQLLGAQGNDVGALALARRYELAAATTGDAIAGLTAAQVAEIKTKYEAIYATEDAITAANAAAQAAAEAARAQQQAAAEAARAQQQAADEAARAAEQIKSAWQSVTDSIFNEVARIRGLLGQGGIADAQSRFAIATAQARAGDQEAARLLPALSQAMLEMAAASASTAAELARMQGRTAASLTTTGEVLAAQYGLSMPSYAVGTPSVPFDMVAQIHKGERIIPAASNDALLEEMRALRVEVVGLRASSEKTAESTGKTTNILRNVTQDGNSLLTTAA